MFRNKRQALRDHRIKKRNRSTPKEQERVDETRTTHKTKAQANIDIMVYT